MNTLRLLILVLLMQATGSQAQSCCSGGSGSPIAGGASQGVLEKKQMEVSSNYQYAGSGKFKRGDADTTPLIDYLYSNYIYNRLAYGISEKLTISVEAGYFLNKTEYTRNKKDTISSSGLADLIIFPRYSVFIRNTEETKTELSLGLGYKIPLGKYNDSFVVYQNPKTLENYYTTAPPTVQPTTGSQDFIFYGFFFRGSNCNKLRFFSNAIYIKKGWNGIGQKFGDYASVGLFASRSFFKCLGVTLQLRGEWIAPMQWDRNVDMLALYNIDVRSTGSKKVFAVPQLSYSKGDLNIYALYEYPLYQYVNRVQVASQHLFTAGLAYRFFLR